MAKYLKPQTPLQHQSGDYIYPITTIDQVLMDNGERLNANIINIQLDGAPEDNINFGINADTLGGISADEYVKLSDLEHLDTSGISIELLWENASPSSEFAAQTINYNSEISENDLVLVIGSEFNTTPNQTYNSCSSTICYIGAAGVLHFAYSEGSVIATRYRHFLPSTTGIEFEEAYAVKGSGTGATNNQKCIPQRIYLIKGVSA